MRYLVCFDMTRSDYGPELFKTNNVMTAEIFHNLPGFIVYDLRALSVVHTSYDIDLYRSLYP